MNRKTIHAIMLLLAVAIAGIPVVSAYNENLSAFNQQYNTDGTRLGTCGVCHVNTNGGGPLNPYGTNYSNENLTAIELLDSDGDGYTNINEIENLTFPGNPEDHPGSAPATEEDNEEDGEGLIGPGNALYGLQIAFENIGETFTFDPNEKLGKQVANARKRIAEARAALKRNDNDAAENALEHYRQKMGEVDKSASKLKDTDSGLANAQQMIAKHEMVLKNLLDSHPGNKGLERAYNNSQELKTKFEEKIKRKEARKDREEETEEAFKIKAKIIGNDAQLEIELKFKSVNTENLTIAQEIHDKLQLSTENINTLLTIENMDKGELKAELEAEASIEKGFSIVEVKYMFPLTGITERNGIVTGIHDKLAKLSTADILNVLEIKYKTELEEVKEAKKDEKQENKDERNKVKEAKKEEKRENQEERRSNQVTRNED